ncbi:YdeI/OmpD-associated family protein [uncultured Lacinutrix sp.]|uniref:YdeI/OmpD-associated family protein n=1 Tax=uncultured Lacinutrix sp. TaxID=574032 RepID=UPI002631B589|nr:YdeI/OmpD-associated family protein [uncultured Lacinutrix sp.]
MIKSKPFKVTLTNKYSIIIPNTVADLFAEKNQKRVKVEASKNDVIISFHAALKKEKTDNYRMYFSNAKQKALDIDFGDTFSIQLFEDQSKYGVEMPETLNAVLSSDYDAYELFENLTPGKKRSIIYAIMRYKNVQTQVDKSIIMTNNLKRGIKDLKLILKGN